MRISVAFTTLFAALSVLALPLAQRDSEPSLSLRSDNVLSGEAIFYRRALTDAQKAVRATRRATVPAAVKAARATRRTEKKATARKDKAAIDAPKRQAKAKTDKDTGLAKSKEQIMNDRKAKKDNKKVQKATRVDKAMSKPGYRSHEQKIKDKAKITFSSRASERLTIMGLHGKARKAVKNFHKHIMLNEMKKKGYDKGVVVATAHEGGTVKEERNHITAHFKKAGGEIIPSAWTDKNGKKHVGDQHHVYVDDNLGKLKKVPSVWTNAVDDHKEAAEASRKAALEAAEVKRKIALEAELNRQAEIKDAKAEKAKAESMSLRNLTPGEKAALRSQRKTRNRV